MRERRRRSQKRASQSQQASARASATSRIWPARTRHRIYSNPLKLACSRISPCMDVSFAAKCRHPRPSPRASAPGGSHRGKTHSTSATSTVTVNGLNTHALCYQRLITDSYVQPIYMRQTFRVPSLTCDFRLARRGAARLPITLLHSRAAHSS